MTKKGLRFGFYVIAIFVFIDYEKNNIILYVVFNNVTIIYC